MSKPPSSIGDPKTSATKVNEVLLERSKVLERRVAERTSALSSANDQLRALTASIQVTAEMEGARISREIHDQLGAALTCLKWDLSEVEALIARGVDPASISEARKMLNKIMDLADQTISAVRKIASELRPVILDDLGLAAAIEWQVRQFQNRTGISCECTFSAASCLDPDQAIQLFRILQESLTNIQRHANASRVRVTLEDSPAEVVLTVKDNGRGISNEQKHQLKSVGLLGMRERAQLSKGSIEFTGKPGRGTTVVVRVPCPDRTPKSSLHAEYSVS